MNKRFHLVLLALCGLLQACETFEDSVVDPFAGQGRYFTIYGFLDASTFQQRIRVIPVRRTPEEITSPNEPNAFIDASVASVDLETGQKLFWQHNLSTLNDSTLAHIYTSSIRIEPGRPYRIEVTRSDSAQTSATTVVPSLSSSIPPEVEPAVTSFGDAFQTVHLTGIPKAFDIEVYYSVFNERTLARVIRPYGAAGAADDEGRWTIDIDLSGDAEQVLREVESELGTNVWLSEMGVRAKWIDDQWPDIDPPFNLDRLGQPGVLSNVENGDGFIGSIGTYDRSWLVTDSELKQMLGFQPDLVPE